MMHRQRSRFYDVYPRENKRPVFFFLPTSNRHYFICFILYYVSQTCVLNLLIKSRTLLGKEPEL